MQWVVSVSVPSSRTDMRTLTRRGRQRSGRGRFGWHVLRKSGFLATFTFNCCKEESGIAMSATAAQIDLAAFVAHMQQTDSAFQELQSASEAQAALIANQSETIQILQTKLQKALEEQTAQARAADALSSEWFSRKQEERVDTGTFRLSINSGFFFMCTFPTSRTIPASTRQTSATTATTDRDWSAASNRSAGSCL